MRKTRWFTPGPTPLIPEAQLALARPLIHHRTGEFRELFLETRANLQQIFKTVNDVLILSSSGTGAMEAAVSNLHSPGDKVVAVAAGKFGERWVQLADSFGLECIPISKKYGQAASAGEILDTLRSNPATRSLLLQGCETSTGTAHDLEAIGRAVGSEFPEVLIIVDAISAVGSQTILPDEWGLDVLICGSQKTFGIPPGLAFLSLSPKAKSVLSSSSGGSHYYLNVRKELAGQVNGATAFSPAISLIFALNEATQQILDQGVEQVIAMAELMARAARAGLEALGFTLLSSSPANALTAAYPPSGISADKLRAALEQEFNVQVAGGQGGLKGKIIRIAHLGYFDLLDVVSVLSAIELILARRGLLPEMGKGVLAAMQEMRESTVSV